MSFRKVAAPVLAVTALAGGLLVAAPTAAAPEARLTGKFTVKETYLKHKSRPADEGTKLSRTWRFTPKCDSGGCDTKLRFRNSDGLIVYNLERKSNLRYKGSAEYDGKCYSKATGEVLDKDAYMVESTVSLKIDQVGPKGGVLAFHTTRKVWHTRKANASKQCDKNDFAKLTGVSQGRP